MKFLLCSHVSVFRALGEATRHKTMEIRYILSHSNKLKSFLQVVCVAKCELKLFEIKHKSYPRLRWMLQYGI